jgi:hypothetical protein
MFLDEWICQVGFCNLIDYTCSTEDHFLWNFQLTIWQRVWLWILNLWFPDLQFKYFRRKINRGKRNYILFHYAHFPFTIFKEEIRTQNVLTVVFEYDNSTLILSHGMNFSSRDNFWINLILRASPLTKAKLYENVWIIKAE